MVKTDKLIEVVLAEKCQEMVFFKILLNLLSGFELDILLV